MSLSPITSCFFFNDTATTEIYTLSLHDALPISVTTGLLAWTAAVRADELLPAVKPVEQAIDHYIDVGLTSNDLKAAQQADDATILRRVTLDLNGRVPTVAALREYLADKSPDKRASLVERLR